MQYRTLGRTGIKVSPYALGALALGAPAAVGNADHDASVRIIQRALDAGINLIDTSDAYAESEIVVGKAVRGRRDSVVIATKFGRPIDDDPGHRGASRRWIMQAVERSLRRLGTDYLDVYQLHRADPDTDLEETLSALTDLVRSGKVRTIGASNTPAPAMVRAQWLAERRGYERLRTEQPPYSLLNRGVENDVLPTAQHYGMGTLTWGPFGQGTLTGRIRRDQPTDLRRAAYATHVTAAARVEVVEQLIPLAAEAGMPLIHLAMAFVTAHPGVSSALLGVRTMEQLDDLLTGLDVTLSDELLDRIDEIVPPGTDVGRLDQAYVAPAVQHAALRRLPVADR
ncbi:aldo/keto reductase [Actinoplanes sp. N902-109]|uniref:aldo/keto reductase n=1 Tax=Actinoplanes sp. (strain N902-109) TaxID=649831 RepID=UPI000329469D|nr:aldo/keto reductase [Actinoplanes sp. N902-109]AGL17518.1 aldo/keto reductase [Actinoplanes sp. N902-109]